MVFKRIINLAIWRKQTNIYNSLWFSKFNNKLVMPWLQSNDFLLKSFKLLKIQKNYSGIFIFYEILEVGKPSMMTKKIRRGKQFYDVPNPLTTQAAYDISLQNFITLINKNTIAVTFYKKIFFVMCDFLSSNSQILNMKNDLHKLVIVNRAYLHYRW